ncbi:hypothetical protein NSA24_10795 [Clostridioides mangenotii]|uniref:hypothetical protein n=1 Tax=Metaclostridioides mangenotii TaxID=1540 RepID=UPI001C11C8C1|nr:hypothetical protein [Clostridioides mangenotii]MBU5308632.1 hypothetical protein [Clostridioides mangenotii]MCR1955278.1 hypothetical protein [Clostridioides mangenotii]
MYSSMEEIKKELQELCNEYLTILDNLKNDDIISQDTYDKCSEQKVSFLEE